MAPIEYVDEDGDEIVDTKSIGGDVDPEKVQELGKKLGIPTDQMPTEEQIKEYDVISIGHLNTHKKYFGCYFQPDGANNYRCQANVYVMFEREAREFESHPLQ